MTYEKEYPCPLNIGDTFSVMTDGGVTKHLKVEYIEPLPPSTDLIHDFGSLAASASSNNNKITELEMSGTKSSDTYHEVFYGWMEILDLIEVEVKSGTQTRYQTKSTNISIGPWSGEVQVVVYQDDVPTLSVTNIDSTTKAKNRIQFWGYRIVGSLTDERTAMSMAAQKGKSVLPLAATGFST